MEPFMKRKFKVFLPGYVVRAAVCLLFASISLGYNGHAQTKNNFSAPVMKLQDSILLRQDFNKDSISKWKQSREFAYMNYLDSLLRKEKNLKSDTVHLDESNGNIKRSQPSKMSHPGLNNLLNSLPFKIFFWVLALVFITYIFYKVVLKNGIFIKKKNNLFSSEEEDALRELNEVSQYDHLISEAENKNDLNLAIRYLFLKTLKTLAEKGFIDFAAEKTNKEYLKEMQQNNYYNEFQKLTRNYEYIWYGKFLIEKKDYEIVKGEFYLFNKNV
jgi:hypothetical protein